MAAPLRKFTLGTESAYDDMPQACPLPLARAAQPLWRLDAVFAAHSGGRLIRINCSTRWIRVIIAYISSISPAFTGALLDCGQDSQPPGSLTAEGSEA